MDQPPVMKRHSQRSQPLVGYPSGRRPPSRSTFARYPTTRHSFGIPPCAKSQRRQKRLRPRKAPLLARAGDNAISFKKLCSGGASLFLSRSAFFPPPPPPPPPLPPRRLVPPTASPPLVREPARRPQSPAPPFPPPPTLTRIRQDNQSAAAAGPTAAPPIEAAAKAGPALPVPEAAAAIAI